MYNSCSRPVPLRTTGKSINDHAFWYVFCPSCGRRISRVGNGTRSLQECPKCNAELGIEMEDSKLSVNVLTPSEKTPADKATG